MPPFCGHNSDFTAATVDDFRFVYQHRYSPSFKECLWVGGPSPEMVQHFCYLGLLNYSQKHFFGDGGRATSIQNKKTIFCFYRVFLLS